MWYTYMKSHTYTHKTKNSKINPSRKGGQSEPEKERKLHRRGEAQSGAGDMEDGRGER